MAIAHQRAPHYSPAHPLRSVVSVVVVAAALLCFFSSNTLVGATTYKVGGRTGWDGLQTDGDEYQDWVLSRTFYVGDTIRFEYNPYAGFEHNPRLNNVVQVMRVEDFILCNQPSIPVAVYASGNDSITFSEEGCYYYISGHEQTCLEGQKVAFSVHRGGEQPDPAEYSPSCLSESLIVRTQLNDIWSTIYPIFCRVFYALMVLAALCCASSLINRTKDFMEGTPKPETGCPDLEQPLLADPSNPDSPPPKALV